MRWLLLLIVFAACGGETPTPTKTVCPEGGTQLTYDNFVAEFMNHYCTSCHDSTLTRSQRNGAPLYHDFDSLEGVAVVTGHIDEQACSGPDADNHFMPGSRCPSVPGGALDIDCPQPTEEERQKLAEWVACCDPVAPNCM